MIDQSVHGQVIVITAVRNDLFYFGKGLVISCLNSCRYSICHLCVGTFQCRIGIWLDAIETENAVGHDTGQRNHQYDDYRKEQADADKDFI